jgi:hypothetical protein
MTAADLQTKIENILRANTKPGYFDKMGWSERQIFITYAIREIEKTGSMTIQPTFHLGNDGNRVIAVAA